MAYRNQIVICGGTGCMSSKSALIKEAFVRELKENNIQDEVFVYLSGCFGLCEKGPVVIVYPDQVFYVHIKEKDVKKIVEDHIIKGKIVSRLEYKERDEKTNKLVRKTSKK